MKKAILMGVTMMAMALAACGDDGEERDVSDVVAAFNAGADATNGEIKFGTTCATSNCHGPDGNSGDGTNMSEGVPKYAGNPSGFAEIIKYGLGDMTPQESILTPQEMADIMQYCYDTFP